MPFDKHVIWQNYDMDYEDWKEDLEEYYPDEEEYTEDDRMMIMYDLNDEYLEDEKVNLNIETDGDIVVIADLGLWYGRKTGWRFVGSNVNECLSFEKDCELAEWYVEGDDLKSWQSHHDGTHYLTYRELQINKDDFEIPLNNSEEYIQKTTKAIGDRIRKVFGWER